MDIAHIILYVAGVALVFILILAIREYYATLRRRRWLTSTGSSSETETDLPPPSNISPSSHPNYTPELRKNEKICGQCGSIWYLDNNFSDYNFCKNSSCSSNVDREE